MRLALEKPSDRFWTNSSGFRLPFLEGFLDLGLNIFWDGLGTGSHRPNQHLLFCSSEHFLIGECLAFEGSHLTLMATFQSLGIGARGNAQCFGELNSIQGSHAEERRPHRLIDGNVLIGSRFGLLCRGRRTKKADGGEEGLRRQGPQEFLAKVQRTKTEYDQRILPQVELEPNERGPVNPPGSGEVDQTP